MGTNLAWVSLMFLYTHTHTHTHLHHRTHYCQPLFLSLSLSQVILLFVMFRGQNQSIWGMGGYSVLKEMLFHKNGHSPFSWKHRGYAATALQSCPENFPWNDFDCLHLKGTSGGFSHWCLCALFLTLFSCFLAIWKKFNSSRGRISGRQKKKKPRCSRNVCWWETHNFAGKLGASLCILRLRK